MKKIVSIILAFTMLLSLCVTSAFAAGESFKLSPGEESYKAGDKAVLSLTYAAGEYAAFSANIAVDDGLTVEKVDISETGTGTGKLSTAKTYYSWYADDAAGNIKLTQATDAILTITVAVGADVEDGAYKVTLNNVRLGDKNYVNIKGDGVVGKITVGEVAPATVEDVKPAEGSDIAAAYKADDKTLTVSGTLDPETASIPLQVVMSDGETENVTLPIVYDEETGTFSVDEKNMPELLKDVTVDTTGLKAPVPQPAAKPVLSVSNGESGKAVKITAEEGNKIYYTTDGSDPTVESSEYTAEISIDKTCTVKAIAVGESGVPSDPVSLTVTIDAKSAEDVEKAIEAAAEGEPVVIDAATTDGNSDSTDVVISDITKLKDADKPVEVKTDVADVELPKEVLANGTGSMTVSVSEDKEALESPIPDKVADLVSGSEDMKVGQAFDVDVTVEGDATATDALTEGLIKIRLKGVAAGLKPGDVIAAEDDNGNPYVYTLKTDADDGKEGYMIDGNDVIIYTSHLTKFMILTAKVTPTLTKVELTKTGKTTNQYTVTVADPAIDYFIVFYVVNTDNGATTLYINPTKMNSTDTAYDFFTNAGSGTLYAYLMAKNPDFTEGMPAVLGVKSVALSALAK